MSADCVGPRIVRGTAAGGLQGPQCVPAECLLRTQVGTDPAEFKNHQLPLARIKKVPYIPTRCLIEHRCCHVLCWLNASGAFGDVTAVC